MKLAVRVVAALIIALFALAPVGAAGKSTAAEPANKPVKEAAAPKKQVKQQSVKKAAAKVQKAKPATAKAAVKPAKPSAKPAKAAQPAKKQAKPKAAKKAAKAALPKSRWSPNGFPVGQRGWCTWYADGRFYEYYNEPLEFNPRHGSNAYTWYNRVTNAEKVKEGEAGDIMVIRRPRKDARGHVAFVESVVPGVGWTVSHSNFEFRGHQPEKLRIVDGRKVYTDIFVPGSKPGTVKLLGGNKEYQLLGFLRKKKSAEVPATASIPSIEGGELALALNIPEYIPAGPDVSMAASLSTVASIPDDQAIQEPESCGVCLFRPKVVM